MAGKAQNDTSHPPAGDTLRPTAADTIRKIDSAHFSFMDSTHILADSVFVIKAKVLYGIASFYSANLDGTQTATGEIFRNKKLTAASNNFKLQTWVRVTDVENGRSVIVRINDRMHKRMAKKGRVVDLSRAAAKAIGLGTKGITQVKVEEIPREQLNAKNVNY